jgi:hypothetical protein
VPTNSSRGTVPGTLLTAVGINNVPYVPMILVFTVRTNVQRPKKCPTEGPTFYQRYRRFEIATID